MVYALALVLVPTSAFSIAGPWGFPSYCPVSCATGTPSCFEGYKSRGLDLATSWQSVRGSVLLLGVIQSLKNSQHYVGFGCLESLGCHAGFQWLLETSTT
ncbi:hypothetical protein AC1031_014113 [Aphanomyces cochlioides]|nr:hypothetical protein AC1031_014113 [Aphanomyces cochlioides]